MAERTRKLHVVIRPSGVAVQLCRWDVAGDGERSVSSTDGIVAIEVFAPTRGGPLWRIVDTSALPSVSLRCRATDAARMAFYAFAEPDVGAIHVVDERIAPPLHTTFLRTRADWLDISRLPHPTYAATPQR